MLKASPVSLNAMSYDAVIRGLKKIISEKDVAPVVTDVFVDLLAIQSFIKVDSSQVSVTIMEALQLKRKQIRNLK